MLIDDPLFKIHRSKDYNYVFRKSDGFFARWGRTKKDDPEKAPFPEILDIEVSIGDCSSNCNFCYKSNTRGNGQHMNLATFRQIIDKMDFLCQIALGITDIDSNPDLVGMLQYARQKGIIPNFTMTGYGLNKTLAQDVAKYVGAIAVSIYPHTIDIGYNAVKTFVDNDVRQVNIHLLYHSKNEDHVYRVLSDIKSDSRLSNINAIVLLSLKTKGRAKIGGFEPLNSKKFNKIIQYCFNENIPLGFDSCSSPKFEAFVKKCNLPKKQKKDILQMCEPCEGTLFSFYINHLGQGFPCSFMEGTYGWETGVNVLEAEDFIRDVWNHPRVENWRNNLLKNCRRCPVYQL
jgi:MoaA/NifB/PqqE/SkfB family radical SAM enzyme